MSPFGRLVPRAGLLALILVAPAVSAQTAPRRDRSAQEEQRRKLLQEMGLQKKEPPPPPPPAQLPPDVESDSDSDAATPPAAAPGTAAPGIPGARPKVAASPSFRRSIHPMMMQTCRSCHTAGAPGGVTRLVLSGDPAADHAAVARLVDLKNPPASVLLVKASGQMHAGGAPWPAGGPAQARMLAWIHAGARLDGGGKPAAPVAGAPAPVPATPPPASKGGRAPGAPRPPAPATAAGAPAADVAPEPPVVTAPAVPPAGAAAAPATPAAAPRSPFVTDVHPLLMQSCAACHKPGGPAAATRMVLSSDLDHDFAAARALVDPASPAESLLLTKASGQMHAGGAPFIEGGPPYSRLLAWVAAGAPGPKDVVAAPAPTAAAPVPGPAVPAATAATAPAAGPPPSPHGLGGHGAPPGLALPLGFMLDGRFDLAYERRQFSGDPFAAGATNALRSYHHFLFLSRESPDDPVGLSVEVLSLQFWEAHVRLLHGDRPWQVVIAGGKILVPFGADPLYHQSYGGLVGFDQRVLPVIWAQEGAAAHFLFHRRALAITDDLYAVRGYALRSGDGVLNLQNDFSAPDASRLGLGNRLGAAWGPLSAWYSTYYNRLGFGRRLFMQAADVTLWRMRQVPVLGHFSFAAGVLRADVSGGEEQGFGGAGKDYYHFASYFQMRYHPTDWLYLQYRQGLRTFNNRRGVIVDETRLTADDGSTHNFGIVARCGGLSAGLFYFINLEKAGEIPDDFFRASVAYDF